ncbi:MAG TPA: GNAT family N-acetyltransferase [Bacillaceae bacterium]
MTMAIEIRVLKTNPELKLVENLERLVWGSDAIPTHQTITAAKNGGLILGAFLQGELVGFSYSFPGFLDGKVYLCSHNLGIHPDHQEKGIGASLKEAQKNAALDMGYRMITWTYDPLETRNAYLNLSKLGAICHTYDENCYGELEDGLNAGLPTDRFKVEWWIGSKHVDEQQQRSLRYTDQPHHVLGWEPNSDQLPRLKGELGLAELAHDGRPILVPVPSNIQEVKRQSLSLAIEWRMKTRHIFQTLFGLGYTAVLLKKSNGEPVHHYVLAKRSELAVPSE